MKHLLALTLTLVSIFFIATISPGGLSHAQQPATVGRQVAITIDDLPAASITMSGVEITAMTAKLLATLQQQKVPVVGFVNEKKLYLKWGEVDERIKALNMWLDAGFELGNHTYGHTSINNGLKEFEEEVVRGETVTRALLAQHNLKMRYFRHPYLDTGRDLQTRRDAEAFLTARGYHIAPVTLDAWDWHFAGVYDGARKRGDTAAQQEIVKAYLAHHAEMFEYEEKFAKELLGYEPKQVLLLHGNNLEAEHIGELIDLMRKRGYSFITLGQAFGDQAYSLPNTYVGEEGQGWIEQWALSLGKIPPPAPPFPTDIDARAKAMPRTLP